MYDCLDHLHQTALLSLLLSVQEAVTKLIRYCDAPVVSTSQKGILQLSRRSCANAV